MKIMYLIINGKTNMMMVQYECSQQQQQQQRQQKY